MKSVLTKQLLSATIVFACLLSSANVFSQSTLNNGLIAYYPFSGNALDSSGNNNNPTYNSATLTADRFGNPNSAYYFDGSSSYIQVPNSSTLNPTSTISISVWVKPTGFYGGTCQNNYIMQKGVSTGYGLEFSSQGYSHGGTCSLPLDTLHQNFYGPTAYADNNTYQPYIKRNNWYHVVYTFNGTTAKIYINDTLSLTTQENFTTFSSTSPLYLGSFGNSSFPYWFNGVLDDIRIYNRAIDSSEVTALYTAPNPVQTSTKPLTLNDSLVAYYPFNGNDLDSSGHNNNPSFNNATPTTDRFGNANSAYYFDGKSSYISVPNSASLNFGTSVTISAWVKPTGFYSGTCKDNVIFSQTTNTGSGKGYSMEFSSQGYSNGNTCNLPLDTLHQVFYGPTNYANSISYQPYIQENKWYHLVFTYNGDSTHFYVNNVLKYSTGEKISPFSNTASLLFGQYGDSSFPYWFNGVLDDIRIYNRAIDSSEVTALYTAPNPIVATPPIIVDSSKCDSSLVLIGSPSNKLFQTSAFLNDPTAGPNGDTSGTELYAFAWTANSIGIPYYNGRSLIKYDISQIPAGAVVKSAKLYLYAKLKNINGVLGSPTYGTNNTALLQKVFTPWTLPNVNYYTKLSVDTATQVILPESTSPTENYVADITAYAQSWVNSPATNNGLLFRMQTESDPYNSMIFESGLASDSSKRPRLEICYSVPPVSADTTHQTITFYGDSSNTGFKGEVIVKDSLLGLSIVDTTGSEICAYSWGQDSINITYKDGWSIIQYDVSQIPPEAVVDSAVIYFFSKLDNLECATGSPTIGPDNEGILNRIIDYWETGNNQHPPVVVIDSLTPVDLPASTSTTEDYKANITDFVKTWVKAPSSNHGMTLKLKNPNTGNNSLIFESSQSSNKARRPKLAVTFSVPKVLPIVLSSFTANTITSPYTRIDFATAHETNAKAINIERSYNGVDYIIATSLNAKGSAGVNSYSYTDKVDASEAKVYYRLKAINKDGSYRYSNTIAVTLANAQKGMTVDVYPNPIRSNDLHANLYLLKDEALTVHVFDMSGKLVSEQKVQGTKGQNAITINAFRTLSAGIYTVNVTSNSEVIKKKVIKVTN